MDGSSHPLTGASNSDGDLEMGTINNAGNNGSGVSSGAISSPGGGLVLRKKLVSNVFSCLLILS